MFANIEILDVIRDEAAIRWFLDCALPGGVRHKSPFAPDAKNANNSLWVITARKKM